MFTADTSPIRAVAWQPDNRWWFTGQAEQLAHAQQQRQQQQQRGGSQAPRTTTTSSTSSSSSQLFITTSNNGNIKVWDVHDVLQACQERMVTRHAINAALWLGPPHMWLTGSADGNIRCFWVDAGVQATNTPQTNADGEGGREAGGWSGSGRVSRWQQAGRRLRDLYCEVLLVISSADIDWFRTHAHTTNSASPPTTTTHTHSSLLCSVWQLWQCVGPECQCAHGCRCLCV